MFVREGEREQKRNLGTSYALLDGQLHRVEPWHDRFGRSEIQGRDGGGTMGEYLRFVGGLLSDCCFLSFSLSLFCWE